MVVEMNRLIQNPVMPDSWFARQIGFTSDKFDGWLWVKDGYVYISFIFSKQPGKGNFSKLIDSILQHGYGVKVPVPVGIMPLILRKKGFKCTREWNPITEEYVDVWVKERV